MMDSIAFDALMAQRDAAYWAGAAAVATWVALVALPINGVGIYLVWRQLRINETALKDATRSADAAVIAAETAALTTRPWVSLDVKKTCSIVETGKRLRVCLDVTIKNIGKTPAVGIWVVQRASIRGGGSTTVEKLKKEHLEWEQAGRTLFPDDVEQSFRYVDLPETRREPKEWDLAISVFYYVPGSNIRRITAKVFRLNQEDEMVSASGNKEWAGVLGFNLTARQDPT